MQKRQDVIGRGGAQRIRRATSRSSLGSPDDSNGAAAAVSPSCDTGTAADEVEGTGADGSTVASSVMVASCDSADVSSTVAVSTLGILT